MKGKAESGYKPSFFDDEDPQTSYGFVRPTKEHLNLWNSPAIEAESVVFKGLNFQLNKQGRFSLAGSYLGYHKDETSPLPTEVISLLYARLRQAKTHQGHGFALLKNNAIFELCFDDEATANAWENALKNVVVMTNFHEEYHGLDVLGEGSFARVYLVRSKVSKKKFAAKVFLKEEMSGQSKKTPKASLLNEIAMMRLFDHENIIKLYEVHETQRSVYLIMEYVETSQTMQSVLKKPNFRISHTEAEVKQMIYSILDALAHMASRGIMHRDLKPGNILLEKGGKIKIIDFGLATYVSEKKLLYERCGTPGYIAPEVFRYSGSDPSTRYNASCDVFSAGCILFFILFGYPMFDGPNSSKIFRLNKNFTDASAIHVIQRELFDSSSRINKAGLSLLLLLIEFSPTRRMSAENALKNIYFNKFTPLSANRLELTTVNSEKNLPSPVSPMDKYKLDPVSLASIKMGKNIALQTLNTGSNGFEPIKTRVNDKYSLHENLSNQELSARGRSGSTEKGKYSINKIDSVTQISNPSSFAPNNNRTPSAQRIEDNKKPYGGIPIQGNQNLLKASLFAKPQRSRDNLETGSPLQFMKSYEVDCNEYLPHETGNSNKMEVYHPTEEDSSDDITDIGDENCQIKRSFTGIKPQKHPVHRGV